MCSGHIPHHKCCSAYVISRVQIAFHIAPYFTYTSHHISHRTIIHIKSLHHISAHHSTSRPQIPPRTTPCTSPHSNITHHTIPQHTFQGIPHIPHCISTIIPHHTMSNMASNHSASHLHHSTPYSPCTTPSFHIASPHFTPDIARHHTMSYILCIAPHSTSRPH